jgi:hypothetical protein
MSSTNIPSTSGLSPKVWSDALFAMAGKQPTPINAISGPAPTVEKAGAMLRRQSTENMPVVRVNDLSQSAGDTVRVDCAHITKLRAIMGDRNAEGMGSPLSFTYMDVKIDMATLPVSAGGKMTQKRFQNDLRMVALNQLKGGIPNFLWQRCLTQMAGARGSQDGIDWVLPKEDDPDFSSMLVNFNSATQKAQAPTYNRHYVIDGGNLVQGGQQLANIDSTDILKLGHLDQLSGLLSELTVRMQPIRIPGDPAAGDDPIKGLLLVDNLVWQQMLADTSSANTIRQWQALAVERARYGNLQQHPLFAASPFLWNGILVRKIGDFSVRFDSGSKQQYVAQGDRYTATESQVTLPNLGNYQVARNLLLGAQALAMCAGANQQSGVPYTMLENRTNYERNTEMAGEIMGAEAKIRFALPDGQGNTEPTDIGVMVLDSIIPKIAA